MQSKGWDFKIGKRLGLREQNSSINFDKEGNKPKHHHLSLSVCLKLIYEFFHIKLG